MSAPRTSPAWQVAYALLDRCHPHPDPLVHAHEVAFTLGHPYTHHGADSPWWHRLAWRKVAARLRWIYAEREHAGRAAATHAELTRRRTPLNVRSQHP